MKLRVPTARSAVFALAATVFIAGLVLGPLMSFLPSMAVFGVSACIALALSFVRGEWRAIAIILFALTLGLWRGIDAYQTRASVVFAPYMDRTVSITGSVSGEASPATSGWRVRVDDLTIDGEAMTPDIDVTWPSYRAPEPGLQIVFDCKLSAIEPIEQYRYDRAQDSRGIGASCSRPKNTSTSGTVRGLPEYILMVKAYLVGLLQDAVPEPHAGFLVGLVFGGSGTLPDAVQDAFSATGLTHILSASGYNASLLSVIVLAFLIETPLGKRRGILATGFLLFAYVIAAGAGAGIVRAAFMSSIALFAAYHGRTALTRNALLAAAAISLAISPLALLWDPSFQLSFVATAALLAWASPVSERLTFIPDVFGLRESFSASLAAMFATTPIVFYHFGSISFVAPIANLLVLPFVPFAMAAVLVALPASCFPWPIGPMLAIPAWALSTLILEAVIALGAVPYASLPMPHPQLLAVISCIPVIIALLWPALRARVSSVRAS